MKLVGGLAPRDQARDHARDLVMSVFWCIWPYTHDATSSGHSNLDRHDDDLLMHGGITRGACRFYVWTAVYL